MTKLIRAIEDEDLKKVQKLIAAGADVDEEDNGLMTPLMMAAEAGRVESMKLLLEKGADATAADGGGCTALHHVGHSDRDLPELIDLLLAAGADIEALDYSGESLPDSGL